MASSHVPSPTLIHQTIALAPLEFAAEAQVAGSYVAPERERCEDRIGGPVGYIGDVTVTGIRLDLVTYLGVLGDKVLTIKLPKNAPNEGVYVFRVHRLPREPDIVYVGETRNLKQRMSDYISGGFSPTSSQAHRIAQALLKGVRDEDWEVSLSLASWHQVVAGGLPSRSYDPKLVDHRRALEALLVIYHVMDEAIVLNDGAEDAGW